MTGTTKTRRYASTGQDTDLSSLGFGTWEEVSPQLPADFSSPIWMSYSSDSHEEARFCHVRVLGCDYLLSTYLYGSSVGHPREEWLCDVSRRNSGQTVAHADTREVAIDLLAEYARTVLTDEDAVIGCLNETDLEFVRQARDAGATICLENDRSERNKRIEIEIGNDLSTEDHPFSQGFRMSAYARPEGCEWHCWYHFNGLHALVSRTRGIAVDASKGFSVARIVDQSRTCDMCGRRIPLDEIQTVGFANGACKACEIPFLSTLPNKWYL